MSPNDIEAGAVYINTFSSLTKGVLYLGCVGLSNANNTFKEMVVIYSPNKGAGTIVVEPFLAAGGYWDNFIKIADSLDLKLIKNNEQQTNNSQ